MRTFKPKPNKEPEPRPGVHRGDHVYFNHKEGPRAGKVLSCGKHGVTAECDKGEKHSVYWHHVLGHKERIQHKLNVVDKGEDGALAEHEDGERVFLEGKLPKAEPYHGQASQQKQPEDGDLKNRRIEAAMKGVSTYQILDGRIPDGAVLVGETAEGARKLLSALERASLSVPYKAVPRTVVRGEDEEHGVLLAFSPEDDQLEKLVNAVAHLQRENRCATEGDEILVIGREAGGMRPLQLAARDFGGRTVVVAGEREGFESIEAYASPDAALMLKATPTVLFFKAPIRGRPGLALHGLTDKRGHPTRRWMSTAVDEPIGQGGGGSADALGESIAPEPATGQVAFASLPDDMQVVIDEYFGWHGFGAHVPQYLPVRRIKLNRLPDTPIDHSRRIGTLRADMPPIVVSGNIWMDGRHRVEAARRAGMTDIVAIDLAGFNIRPERGSSDYIARIKGDISIMKSIILFLKADKIANRAGLALQATSDKLGHQVKRWKRTGPEAKGKPREKAAPPEAKAKAAGKVDDATMRGLRGWVREYQAARHAGNIKLAKEVKGNIDKHISRLGIDPKEVYGADPDAPENNGGRIDTRATKQSGDTRGSKRGYGTHHIDVGDHVSFEAGDIKDHGEIIAHGKDGATVKGKDGTEHKVAWAEVRGHTPKGSADGAGGGKDKKPPGGSGDDAGEGAKGQRKPTVLGKQEPIPADKFVASDYGKSHDKSGVTVDDIMAEFPQPETKEKIDAAVQRLASIEQTITDHRLSGDGANAIYDDERKALHKRIFYEPWTDNKGKVHLGILDTELLKAAKPEDGEKPVFVMLGGRGGSGKSKLNGVAYDPARCVVLDADDIKQRLPEYEGWNASVVHEESSDLLEYALDLCREIGLNVVLDATMKTTEHVIDKAEIFKGGGYRLEVHYMHLPRQEAAKRAILRFLGKSRRLVPTERVLDNTTNEASFDQVRKLADAWSFRDNNVPDGTDPILISSQGVAALAKRAMQKAMIYAKVLFVRRSK